MFKRLLFLSALAISFFSIAFASIDNMEALTTDAIAQSTYVSSSSGSEVVDQQQTATNYIYNELGHVSSFERRQWQSFKLSAALPVSAIEVRSGAVKVGSPTGNWTIKIETDNSGVHSGTLANANSSVIVAPPNTETPVKGTFANTFTLSANTTYWIGIDCDNQSLNNYWYITEAPNTYADGNCGYSDNGTFHSYPYDLYFKVYVLGANSLQSYFELSHPDDMYSLKGVATTGALNETLTKTFNTQIDLTDIDTITYNISSTRTGSNLKLSLLNNQRTWTERQIEGDVQKNWSVTADSDGSNLIAAVNTGRLYTSTDYGTNWTERRPKGDVDGSWLGLASDSDGSFLIVGEFTGRLYTSADGGANWTERTPAGSGDKQWRHLATDSDGSNLIACTGEYTGRLYTSADYGVTWTERQPVGNVDKHWWGVASDNDGSNLIASVYNASTGDRLYTSSDYGANWTERRPVGDVNKSWLGVASDSTGTHLIACCKNYGRIYTSADSGASWTERRPIGDADAWWYTVGMSSNGSCLVAGANVTAGMLGRLFVSTDYGATWTEQRPLGDVDQHWYRVSISSDGVRVIACSALGRLFTSLSTDYTIETTPNITTANEVQQKTIDISSVTNNQKSGIGTLKITVVNSDQANTFTVDNIE